MRTPCVVLSLGLPIALALALALALASNLTPAPTLALATSQIEQQFSSLPVDRTKDARGSSPPAVRRELGSRGHPSKADAAQGQKPLLRKANPNPLSQANLFEKECTPRPESPRSLHERQNPKAAQRKPAGLKTATIARNEPYFLTDLDAGVKLGATHPSRSPQRAPASRILTRPCSRTCLRLTRLRAA